MFAAAHKLVVSQLEPIATANINNDATIEKVSAEPEKLVHAE